jgi:hypothetical protein
MVPNDGSEEHMDVTAAMYEPAIGHDLLDDLFAEEQP